MSDRAMRPIRGTTRKPPTRPARCTTNDAHQRSMCRSLLVNQPTLSAVDAATPVVRIQLTALRNSAVRSADQSRTCCTCLSMSALSAMCARQTNVNRSPSGCTTVRIKTGVDAAPSEVSIASPPVVNSFHWCFHCLVNTRQGLLPSRSNHRATPVAALLRASES